MFNTQCCFPAVRFSSHKPVLRWTRVVRRPRVFSFFCPRISFVCLFFEQQSWWVTSAVRHVSSWEGGGGEQKKSEFVVLRLSAPACPDRPWPVHTCGKPLLVERKSVSAALKLHVDPWQGGPLVQKLHRQGGGARGAVWKFKLGPQRPGTWSQNTRTRWDLERVILISQQQQQQNADLPSFSDFSEMSLNFHKHLLCSEFLQSKRRRTSVFFCDGAAESLAVVWSVLSLQLCSSPDGGRQGLHAGDAPVHRHQDLHVGERPGGCHGFWVVAIVYPQVRRARRALPVYGQVEGGGVDPVRLHLEEE